MKQRSQFQFPLRYTLVIKGEKTSAATNSFSAQMNLFAKALFKAMAKNVSLESPVQTYPGGK